ncbi:MAG TPA: SRPBCC family protein, partial [Candidatus Eisenbacteria bacterium]|nr:SRPBCC family protein [Candidatus Eisenbacteria bacterium]
MSTESVRVAAVIPATPERLYAAWLDAREHAAMTGGAATVEPRVGGRFTAWDGYITGVTLVLERGRRIVQAWRSTDFPDGHPDSRLEVRFEPAEGGTRVTVLHAEVPEGQGSRYEQGWSDSYLEPMRRYFGREAAAAARAAA